MKYKARINRHREDGRVGTRDLGPYKTYGQAQQILDEARQRSSFESGYVIPVRFSESHPEITKYMKYSMVFLSGVVLALSIVRGCSSLEDRAKEVNVEIPGAPLK